MNFFTRGEHPITDTVLCEFLLQKKDSHIVDNKQKILSELMQGIRFIAPQNKVEHDTDSILNALFKQYDQQNILTAKFLYYLRDVS